MTRRFFEPQSWNLQLFRQHRSVVVVLVGVLVIGLALAFLGCVKSSAAYDVWSEISKAGVQIAVIAFLGGVVNATFKYVDECRARDERRRRVFHEVLVAYNQAKSVRRNLRALGMLMLGGPLTAQQARGLRAQMMVLNEAQLALEATKRAVAQSGLFRDLTVVGLLERVEHYLGDCVLKKWEEEAGRIWEGAEPRDVEKLRLTEFIGHKRDCYHNFEDHVSTPLDNLTEILHAELFGSKRELKH